MQDLILATPELCPFDPLPLAVHPEPLERDLLQIGEACEQAKTARHRLKCLGRKREKVFGQGRAIPLDRNAKARIWAYALAYTAKHREPRQGRGPLSRAFLDVLRALLWAFHNQHTGRCFPSYERVAEAAKVHRSTVNAAINALELAGVMTWENRLIRERVKVPGLLGPTVILVPRRSSYSYRFRDPQPAALPMFPKSESPTGTGIKAFQSFNYTAKGIPNNGAALERLDAVLDRWSEDIRRQETEAQG